ncbi:Clp protease N-terminal domain-containing protein [Streptomyces sp. DG2A-72]|uniref:Clp protease N-terminal domain-containing protein n=1 Tax=Streptomyces sp. DG2A-72 TaxID=3051386 RepID=UPI00265BAE39|nr:Clp protease N-terminal domain-containing protein [Streptomyces sp. DG2A-72]MDO0936249.1 Clp protease N-terminal domain-containing protein [Streptomyces sp. DG2A-72]
MFERFTKDARAVVEGAVGCAEREQVACVDTEHMLLALLDREGSRGSFALSSLLGNGTDGKESVRSAVVEARRRGGLSRADADALAGLGIDVTEIVARVEEVHGVGAMSGDRRGKGWFGHRPFSRGAKDTLVEALRVASGRRDRHIGDEHILLALAARPGVPAEVLADHGVTYEALTRVLYGGGEAKAG